MGRMLSCVHSRCVALRRRAAARGVLRVINVPCIDGSFRKMADGSNTCDFQVSLMVFQVFGFLGV